MLSLLSSFTLRKTTLGTFFSLPISENLKSPSLVSSYSPNAFLCHQQTRPFSCSRLSSSKTTSPRPPPSPKAEINPNEYIDDIGKLVFGQEGTNARFGDADALQPEDFHVDSIQEPNYKRAHQFLSKNPLDQFQFFEKYPKDVKRWLINSLSAPGVFNKEGEWEPISEYKALFGAKTDFTYSPASSYMKEYDLNDIQNPEEEGDSDDVPSSTKKPKMFEIPKRWGTLPADLIGKYRFGIDKEEIKQAPEHVKRLLSFQYASNQEILHYRMEREKQKWQTSPLDTGSSVVQAALLHTRIQNMKQHLLQQKKDHAAKYRLRLLMSTLNKVLRYLKRKDIQKFIEVTSYYGMNTKKVA